MVGEKIGRVLLDQENYITNKIELMVSQFLTTGIVKSGDKEAEYEVNYELGNKITLDSTHKWGAAGVETESPHVLGGGGAGPLLFRDYSHSIVAGGLPLTS